RPYLATYSNSMHAAEVQDKLLQWLAEREQVAAGKVKYRGRWMPAAEAQRLIESDRARQAWQHARELLAHGDYEGAIAAANALAAGKPLEAQDDTQRFLAEVYQRWHKSLEDQARTFDQQLQTAEKR